MIIYVYATVYPTVFPHCFRWFFSCSGLPKSYAVTACFFTPPTATRTMASPDQLDGKNQGKSYWNGWNVWKGYHHGSQNLDVCSSYKIWIHLFLRKKKQVQIHQGLMVATSGHRPCIVRMWLCIRCWRLHQGLFLAMSDGEGGERLARFFSRPRWSLKPKLRRGLSEETIVNWSKLLINNTVIT